MKVGNGQCIAFHAEATDAACAYWRDHAFMTEFFPCMYIADMHFYNGCFNGSDRIAYSYGRMRVTAGVKYDTVVRETYFMQMIYECTFGVTLKIGKFCVGI